MFTMRTPTVLALPLLAQLCVAVHQGYLPKSPSEVPYATGFLMKLDESDPDPAYKNCLMGDDDTLHAFCGGGLISEGVFITAAHCFEEGTGFSLSGGTVNVANIRVGLGARYPYRNDDGTCTGKSRGTSEQIYKVKAVFIHKHFKKITKPYQYTNAKTGKSEEGELTMDHMDVAVVLLDQCTSPVAGSNKPRHGKIAGGKFSELSKMWKSFGSKTNTEGLPGTFWGYGESEDDTKTLDSKGKPVPKPVRRANWNFNRATGPQRKAWANCDWLPDSTPVWNYAKDKAMQAFTAPGGKFKASPFLACTPRNPNDPSVKSRCKDQVTQATCVAKKTVSAKSYCKWNAGSCVIDENVAGGIGLVTYPSTGGGDSGSAAWYIENANKLTLQDRDQLNLVHIGIIYAATTHFPEWDQVIRTDYLQNWLATVIDRDSCAAKPTKDYFVGFDHSVVGGSSSKPSAVTQSGWDLGKDYLGLVKGSSGTVALSKLPKRANAGDWSKPGGATTGGATTPGKPGGNTAGGATTGGATTGGAATGGATTGGAGSETDDWDGHEGDDDDDHGDDDWDAGSMLTQFSATRGAATEGAAVGATGKATSLARAFGRKTRKTKTGKCDSSSCKCWKGPRCL